MQQAMCLFAMVSMYLFFFVFMSASCGGAFAGAEIVEACSGAGACEDLGLFDDILGFSDECGTSGGEACTLSLIQTAARLRRRPVELAEAGLPVAWGNATRPRAVGGAPAAAAARAGSRAAPRARQPGTSVRGLGPPAAALPAVAAAPSWKAALAAALPSPSAAVPPPAALAAGAPRVARARDRPRRRAQAEGAPAASARAPGRCARGSLPLLQLEFEALRRAGQPTASEECDIADMAADWWGGPVALQTGALHRFFGRRAGQRHVTAAMYIVMAWSACCVVLMLRLTKGLFRVHGRHKNTDKTPVCKCVHSREALAWSRGFFSWLTLSWGTHWLSKLTSQPEGFVKLRPDDLGPVADPDDSTQACHRSFEEVWRAEIAEKGLANASLKRALFQFVGYPKMMTITLIVIVLQAMNYIGSFIVMDVCLGYVEWVASRREKEPHAKFQLAAPSVMMICAYTVVPLSTMALVSLLQLMDRRIDMRNEAALGMMVYDKAQRLPSWLRQHEEDRAVSKVNFSAPHYGRGKDIDVVQLIVVDVKQNCSALASTLSSVICLPVFLTVVAIVTWQHLGTALLFALLGMVPVAAILRSFILRLKDCLFEVHAVMDRRLARLQEVLLNIRIVKTYSWEEACEADLVAIRKEEIRQQVHASIFIGLIGTTVMLTPRLLSLSTLISRMWAYGDVHQHLIFVTLQILKSFVGLVQSGQEYLTKGLLVWPSLQRLENFLKLPEAPERPRAAPGGGGPAEAGAPLARLRGSFPWHAGGPPVLHDIDLAMRRGALVGVVGELGAGKSALLQALLGELPAGGPDSLLEGPEHVAYCAQTPWIASGTVRENVLGPCVKAPDERRYAQALAAAALHPDLEAWPGGDAAQVGVRGTRLSGGQRVRVALARALYDRAELLLLDDPLAAVDARTGEALLQQLQASELLKGRTCVVTLQPDEERLARFDEVIVLSQGRVAAQGAPAKVLGTPVLRRLLWSAPKSAVVRRAKGEHLHDLEGHLPRSEEDALALNTDEELQWANWQSLGFLLNSGHTRYVAVCGCLQLLYIAVCFMSDLQFAHWANAKQSGQQKTSDIAYIIASGIWTFAGALIAAANVASAVTFVRNASESVFVQVVHSLFRASIAAFHDQTPVGHIMARLSYDVLMVDRQLYTMLIALLLDPYMIAFSLVYVHASMPGCFTLMTLPFYGLVAWLGKLYLQAVPAVSLLQRATLSKMTSHLVDVEDMRVAVRSYRGLMESFKDEFALNSDNELKAHFLVSPVLGLWFKWCVTCVFALLMTLIALGSIFAPQHLRPGTFALCLWSLNNVMSALPRFFESFVCLQFELAGVRRLREYSLLPPEGPEAPESGAGLAGQVHEVVVALPEALELATPPQACAAPWVADGRRRVLLMASADGAALEPAVGATLAELVPGCEALACVPQECRIVGVGDASGSAGALARALCASAGQQRTLRLEGMWLAGGARVRVEALKARYRGSTDVLRGVDLALEPAQRVGVMGRTGCGKSTLLLALLRIVEPRSGRVLLNGVDTSAVSLTTLRRAVGLVPQDPVVFSGSLRHNLDPSHRFTDGQLWEAARAVQAAEFVEALPGRLEHIIASGRGTLSTGQRQLLSLARMVPRQPGLLLMDEATSSIDPRTQETLLASIFSAFRRSTIVAVAHNLETILAFDHCVVMDSGVVVEHGPVPELQKADGLFARMLAASSAW